METLRILLFYATVVNATWPDCVQHQINYDGLNKISGYRSSNEGCAHWCEALGNRCVRWVYQDSPANCFLKAFEGNAKDKNDPLTLNDHEEFKSKFGDPYNQTNPEVIARINLRKEQLLQLHTGDSSCKPDVVGAIFSFYHFRIKISNISSIFLCSSLAGLFHRWGEY